MPLCDASADGNIEEVQRHIAAGTDLNAQDNRGRTPLSAAVIRGQLEVIKLLTKAGANPTIDSRQGVPFITAIQRGNLEMVRFFVVDGGVNVNANINGSLPLSAARRQPEIAAFLREHGAVEPMTLDDNPYGAPTMPNPTGPQLRGRPGGDPFNNQPDLLADPNAIRAKIRSINGLEAQLKVLDTNAVSEMRSWRQRKIDNRTSVLRSVKKQFEDEMLFVKGIALKETASQTPDVLQKLKALLPSNQQSTTPAEPNSAAGPRLIASIDELVARRTERYELISEELREQRRDTLRQSRESNTSTRGRGRGRGRGMTETTSDYQAPPRPTLARTDHLGPESNEPALDPDTENQLNAWLNANPEDKRDLLEAVFEMDLVEYGVLHHLAETANAPNTAASLAGLMLARQERLNSCLETMAEDDERLQKLEERNSGTRQEETTSRRGRRSR